VTYSFVHSLLVSSVTELSILFSVNPRKEGGKSKIFFVIQRGSKFLRWGKYNACINTRLVLLLLSGISTSGFCYPFKMASRFALHQAILCHNQHSVTL